MPPFRGLDQRLLELINGPESPYHHFRNYPPIPVDAPYEPASLDFLHLIDCFHIGEMPSYRFVRTPALYNVLVNRFTKLTADLAYLLTHVMYYRLFMDPQLLGYSERLRIKAVYTRYNLYEAYPIPNLLHRIYTTITVIRLCPVPRMQRFDLRVVHPEIIRMVAKNLTYADMRRFSQTCRFVRKACEQWVHMRTTFSIEYDHNATRSPARNTSRFLDRLHNAIDHAVDNSLQSMWTFVNHAEALQGTRLLTFDNQWERYLPVCTNIGPPSPLNTGLYRQLHNAIAALLRQTQPAHLRLISIGITSQLFLEIHRTEPLTHLTLHSCTPDRFTAHRYNTVLDCEMHLSNITFLAIGFSRHVPNNVRCWDIFQFCFRLRHFHAYPADSSTTIAFPDRELYANLAHIHTLERFHVDGASSSLPSLIEWLQRSAKLYASHSHGSLTHLKLHTRFGMCTDDLIRLLGVLAILHPGIRVLVLVGVLDTTRVVRDISYNFPRLEGLGLYRMIHEDQKTLRLCQWELPTYAYAAILSKLPRLRHFEANFDYTPFTFAPAAFSACVYPVHPDPLYDCASENADHRFDLDVIYNDNPAIYLEIVSRLNRTDSLRDGPAIARPFAASCRTMSSFAIKNDSLTHFSCMIGRKLGKYVLYDTFDHRRTGGFEDWNPPYCTTWADSTTAVM